MRNDFLFLSHRIRRAPSRVKRNSVDLQSFTLGGSRCASRWTPAAEYPWSKAICNGIVKGRKQRFLTAQVVSEKLCDDILHRLAPFLRRDPPIDIIDLWPGAGFWSSKVNDFLRPRRHVLIEPSPSPFETLVAPLAKSKPCYELLSHDPYKFQDWEEVVAKSLPELQRSRNEASSSAPASDTLLILANPPTMGSKKDHNTPTRWWSSFLESCLRKTGVHAYGNVRVIAWMPSAEADSLIPQSAVERKRAALLTEAVASHAFHVAATDQSPLNNLRDWDVLTDSAACANKRASEANVTTPVGRAMAPVQMAPQSPNQGSKPVPYVPRPRTGWHSTALPVIEEYRTVYEEFTQRSPRDPTTTKAPKQPRELIYLNQENRDAHHIKRLVDLRRDTHALSETLAQAVAQSPPNETILADLDRQLADTRTDFNRLVSALRPKIRARCLNLLDDWLAAMHSGSIDDSVLLWDRRPFEPLRIHPNELYPRGVATSVVYAQTDASQSPVLKALGGGLQPERRAELAALLESVLLALGSRNDMSVAMFLGVLFPERTAADVATTVPSLARFAARKIDPVALDVRTMADMGVFEGGGTAAVAEKMKKTEPFAGIIEYDFGGVRVRSLPLAVLWDVILEYDKAPFKQDAVRLNMALGGTLTTYRAGSSGASLGLRNGRQFVYA